MRTSQRMTADQTDIAAAEAARLYNAGWSIRQIASDAGYSIGRVRRLLLARDDVKFRPKGGANRL